jgi:hypothetical protein
LKIPTTGNKVDERMSIWEIVTENQDCENVWLAGLLGTKNK